MASRLLSDLVPECEERAMKMLSLCKDAGCDVLVICTRRSYADQAALYAQGRTAAGNIVTYSRAGEGAHEKGEAFDVVLMRDGKPVWSYKNNESVWEQIGAIGESVGLEWSGRWKKFREYGHFQLPNF